MGSLCSALRTLLVDPGGLAQLVDHRGASTEGMLCEEAKERQGLPASCVLSFSCSTLFGTPEETCVS